MSEERVRDLSYMTGVLNAMAKSGELDLFYTVHCRERMLERGITTLDIIYILKNGEVEEYQGQVGKKIHKYKMTGKPIRNNSFREVSIILLVEVDNYKNPSIKLQEIVTSMWKDL